MRKRLFFAFLAAFLFYIVAGGPDASAATVQTLRGVVKYSSINVYATPSAKAKVLKHYTKGDVLSFQPASTGYYKIKSTSFTGYIRTSDVETATLHPVSVKGILLKSSTKLYSKASTSSAALKSYPQGTVLTYKTFTSGFYQYTTQIGSKTVTGYIAKSDTENASSSQTAKTGIVLKNPTILYSRASTGSSPLKTYAQGTKLTYKTFSAHWYTYTTTVNGKTRTGYIYKNDVEAITSSPVTKRGISLPSSMPVYTRPSTVSKVLKHYAQGSLLTYKTFTSGWYTLNVKVNGKTVTGYVKKNDMEAAAASPKTIEGSAVKSPTKVYERASTASSVLKSYYIYTPLTYQTFTSKWYTTTVMVNGKKTTGYISKSDVAVGPFYKYTHYGLTVPEMVAIQAKTNPQTDLYAFHNAYVLKSAVKLKKGSTTKGTVTAASAKVLEQPKSGSWVYGTLKKDAAVTIVSSSNKTYYQIKYQSFRNAKPADIQTYVNPANYPKVSSGYFQFLALDQYAGSSVGELNDKILKGKGVLEGKGSVFIDASKKYHVNELYLISHALLETGNGTSKLATGIKVNGVTVYNMFGIHAYDSDPDGTGSKYAYEQGWTSVDKAIEGGAEWISKNYTAIGQNSLYTMRWNPVYADKYNGAAHQYATDIGWAVKQVNNIKKLYDLLDRYTLVFDVPVYQQ